MLRIRTAAAVGAVVFALAACSDGNGGEAASGGQPSAGESTAGSGAKVAVATGDLGPMLVDANGRTLYVFLADDGGKSTCYDDCASSWPALESTGTPRAGDGINASMLGTTTRTDGSTQVTFDGHPLYLFAGDSGAGDTKGQGIGDVWFVVSPKGSPIQDTGGSGSDGSGSRGSGY